MTDYSKITQEQFNEALGSILSDMNGEQLLSIPGIYEVLSEHFNNDALAEAWDRFHEPDFSTRN